MIYWRKICLATMAFSLSFGLAACDENEQNRPLTYKKGVYGGAVDQELNEDQRRELRRRGDKQRF